MSELPELWQHQVDCIERATAPGVTNFAIFHEPGCGKTRTMLEILKKKYNAEKRVMRTIIVAPVIVLGNWQDEIFKFTKIPKEKVTILEGSIKSKADELKSLSGIVILNYDVFVKKEFADAVIAWEPEILVLDEVQRVKDGTAKRTKNLMKISASMGKYGLRYIMTGSPITNSQMDLFSQFYILDNGATFGENFFGFRAAFFMNVNAARPRDGKYFPMWVPKKGIDQELNRRIKEKASIVKKEDCLDLPPFIQQDIYVPLSPVQKRLYDEMKRDYITFINDKAAIAPIALTKLIRMQQILSGFLKTEDGKTETFENPRERVLGELLSDICGSGKCLVWSIFKQDYITIRRACEKYGIRYVEINGELQRSEKEASIKSFKEEEDVRVLISNPSSGGVGITLTVAKYMVYFSRSFSLEHQEQSEARAYRAGSEIHDSIHRFDLVAPGTLDSLILDALKAKKNIVNNVLNMDISKL